MKLSFTRSFINLDKLGGLIIKDHHTYIDPIPSNHITKNWGIGYDSDSKCHFTGLFDLLGNFYILPIQIYYVQFGKIDENKISLVLYNKEFSKHKNIQVTDLKNLFPDLQKVLNYLNIIVDNGLDIDRISDCFSFLLINDKLNSNFIEDIQNLKFEFFNVGVRLVGKDNQWWDEIEITNLPKDDYINSILKKSAVYDKNIASLKSDKLIISYNHDSGFCSIDDGRFLSEFNDLISKTVFNTIVFNFNKFYSEIDYFEFLISK